MALRMASYFGKTLDMMFGSEIFGTRKMMIPPPCFLMELPQYAKQIDGTPYAKVHQLAFLANF